MASIVKRGSRANPRYYVKHQPAVGPGFQRLLPGVVTKDQALDELNRIKRDLAAGRDPFPEPAAAPESVRALMERWRDSLANRNADDDRSRINRHLIPRFGDMRIEEVTLPVVMNWIDELPKTELSGQSQRHLVNGLSRFFSWAIERGLANVNPVRMVPQRKRPVAKRERVLPWLEDDSKVPQLMEALGGGDLSLMFYLCNRSGLRLGEVCGLTMGDLEDLGEGRIRVGHSYGGPLKEDKTGEGKSKWVPAPVDAKKRLSMHLRQRKLHGAKADDLVFPFLPAKPQNRRRTSGWTGYRKEYVEACWEKAAEACGVELTWYESTRHSFVSRCLKNGATLDEVSAAVGHSSPIVTRRFYDRWVRKTFSDTLRAGLG